nr:MAG: ORF1 [TTV-like mini virus]
MPWFWRKPYYQRRKRNWYRRRRFRPSIRRRRHRRYRVRHFKPYKSKKITIQQFQPPSIRRCKIKGKGLALLFNEDRLAFNSQLYEKSIVPEKKPGGGGFSVMHFTLENLYTMFEYCTNWWTASNQDLPLVRYRGCKIKCYQSKSIDYILKWTNTLPSNSNKLTYPACQPSMLAMAHTKLIMPSKQTNNRHKPYKILRIPPPPQLKNQWYFQQELADKPLLTLHTAAAGLDTWYIANNWDSDNITITHINTDVFTNRNFQQEFYPTFNQGTQVKYLWKVTQEPYNFTTLQVQDIVPLTNMKNYVEGATYREQKVINPSATFQQYKSHIKQFCGNPLILQNRQEQDHYYYSTYSPVDVFTITDLTENTKVDSIKAAHMSHNMTLTKLQEPLILKSRYNPLKDKGDTTKMYLLDVKTTATWDPPTNPDYVLDGFPMWINIYGFCDFQMKLQQKPSMQSNYALVIQNHTTNPIRNKPIILIDEDYLNNNSPYDKGPHPQDADKWYPQLQYQEQQINLIAKCGIGTPKLTKKYSDQVILQYTFYFSWGGSPAKMVTVDNPLTQIVYPIPRTEHAPPSLQNPETNFESILYTFDQRHGSLTKRALERIKSDWNLTQTLSSFAEATSDTDPLLQAQEQEETQKEKEKALVLKLQQHKQQQLELRFRILKLMETMQM